jgi:two-component system response regulator YesN
VYKRYYKDTREEKGGIDPQTVLKNGCFLSEKESRLNDIFPFLNRELLQMVREKRDRTRTLDRIYGYLWLYRQQNKYRAQINRAVSFIEAHYNSPLSLSKIASFVNISPTHLNRIFRLGMGSSCMDYVIGLRLKRACDLLQNTNYRVNEIARHVGYDNPYYFSRLFKNKLGVPPVKYAPA